MKKLITIILAAIPMFLIAQEGSYTLKGKIGQYSKPAKAYLRYYQDEKLIIDSCTLNGGHFIFNGKLEGIIDVYLMLDYTGKGLNVYKLTDKILPMYLEKGVISITANDSLNNVVISGSVVNDANKRYLAPMAELTEKFDHYYNLERNMIINKTVDTALMAKYDRILLSTNNQRFEIMKKYVDGNPDSYLSLVAITEMDPYADPDKSLPLFLKLSESAKNTPLGRKFKSNLDKGLLVSAGVQAPDFTENDVNGKPIKLSDFEGKYVLLDFWASWCGPCRAETPNVIKAYNEYKSKNFTVLSVSLDDLAHRKNWLNAIEKDKMPWTNISALMSFDGPGAKLYNIGAIPSNFLIDPNGKIIARNLLGEKLNDKLKEIIK